MRISIFGLGYVGSVSAGCLAALGHHVIGVDPIDAKVAAINGGTSPVFEKDLDKLIAASRHSGHLRATVDAAEAVQDTELSLICVGTPSGADGAINLAHALAAAVQIGAALKHKVGHHTVVVRSTIMPGALLGEIVPALEAASGKKAGRDFSVGHNPEFMREGSAVADFHDPPKTVIGALDEPAARAMTAMYETIKAPLIATSVDVSEMVKYADNAWHALKIAFANEMASLAQALQVDGRAVMDIFCQDMKLNLSSAYLRPGFAFGGSCLPKDLRALCHAAVLHNVPMPVLEAILASNQAQIDKGFARIMALGDLPIALLGLSFKAGTDDLRESQNLALANRLQAAGRDVKIFDRQVEVPRLVGANRAYLMDAAPALISTLLPSLEAALAHGRIIVVANGDAAFLDIASRLSPQHIVVDLVGIRGADTLGARYQGINW